MLISIHTYKEERLSVDLFPIHRVSAIGNVTKLSIKTFLVPTNTNRRLRLSKRILRVRMLAREYVKNTVSVMVLDECEAYETWNDWRMGKRSISARLERSINLREKDYFNHLWRRNWLWWLFCIKEYIQNCRFVRCKARKIRTISVEIWNLLTFQSTAVFQYRRRMTWIFLSYHRVLPLVHSI